MRVIFHIDYDTDGKGCKGFLTLLTELRRKKRSRKESEKKIESVNDSGKDAVCE